MDPVSEKSFKLWKFAKRIINSEDLTEDPEQETTEKHVNCIRQQYNQLVSNLTHVQDIAAKMFESDKLTPKDLEHVRQFHSTPIKAAVELLSIVIRSSNEVYECFLQSLKETNQLHIHQMLTSENITENNFSNHSDLIRRNYRSVLENIDPGVKLTAHLYENGVLSDRELQEIVIEKNVFKKSEIVLSLISRKSAEDFNRFLDALRNTNQAHVIEILQDVTCSESKSEVGKDARKVSRKESSRKTAPKTLPKPFKKPTEPLVRTKPVLSPKPYRENIESTPAQTPSFTLKPEQKKQKRRQHDIKKQMMNCHNDLQTDILIKVTSIRQRAKKKSNDLLQLCLLKVIQETGNKVNEANQRCEQMKQQIYNERLVIEHLQTEHALMKTQNNLLTHKCNETQTENFKLNKLLQKCESEQNDESRGKYSRLQKELLLGKSDNDKLRKDFQECKIELNKLKVENHQAPEENEEKLKSMKIELVTIKTATKEKDKLIELLQRQLHEISEKAVDLEKRLKEVELQKSKLSDDAQKALITANAENNRISKKCLEIENELCLTLCDNEELNAKVLQYKNEVKSVAGKISEANRTAAEKDENISTLMVELASTKQDLEELKKETDESETKLKKTQETSKKKKVPTATLR